MFQRKVCITQVRWLTTADDSRSRYSALLWPLQVLTLICTYTHTNNLKIKQVPKKKEFGLDIAQKQFYCPLYLHFSTAFVQLWEYLCLRAPDPFTESSLWNTLYIQIPCFYFTSYLCDMFVATFYSQVLSQDFSIKSESYKEVLYTDVRRESSIVSWAHNMLVI